MVNNSPVFFLLFALIFYSHFNGAFDDAEHFPIGVQDRAKLLAQTDVCALKYLERKDETKKMVFLPHIVKRCALTEYFPLEKFGKSLNGSSIYSFLPLFQHSHLRKCNGFLFFGTSSYDMSAELEIIKHVDFQMLKCNYLIMDKRTNLHGLENFIQLAELTETHLNDILFQYKDDKDYVIEHLFIAESAQIENFMDKLLKFRKLYSLTICQITIRLSARLPNSRLWKLSEEVLIDDYYVLMNVQKTENYTEFFLFANNEYQCMMRYL